MPQRQPLQGQWFFRPDLERVGLSQHWTAAPIDGEWKPIHVPGAWEWDGFGDYDGIGWYAIDFTPPPPVPGKQRGIVFFGVDDAASVWLNGEEIAREHRANRRFAFDIDPLLRPGVNMLRVRVEDRGGNGGITRPVYIGACDRLEDLYVGEHHNQPARVSAEWVRDAVLYSAYLRSASPEGTFKGLERRLDEIKELGVSVIWLLPIHPVGEKNRKGPLGSPYAVSDFYKTNPEFGTLDDFKSLLAATHQRGMKLIIDLVINHTGWDGPLIEQHPEWFRKDKDGKIVSPNPDWTDVAQLDYSQPALREWMQQMMLYWVRDVGIDGFRCDVAGMVPRSFWEEVRPKLDAVKRVMMLAEDDEPAQHLVAFDLTYDWHTYDLLDKLRAGEVEAAAINDVLREEDWDYPRGALRLRFSDNHDKNAWVKPAIERYGPEGMRLAAVLTYALPGVPLIYNGQEVGSPTRLPLFEKVAVDWSQDPHEMRGLYRELSRLRREHAALRGGSMRIVPVGEHPHTLVIDRRAVDDHVLTVINLASKPRSLPREGLLSATAERLLGAKDANLTPAAVELPAFGWLVVRD